MQTEVQIPVTHATLEGTLTLPEEATRLVIFAHGSGSSRLSPRNQFVARVLSEAGIGTLLFDLLTAHEDTVDQNTAEYRFDIPLLSNRLLEVTDWVQAGQCQGMHIGYFGSSTGAAAALVAAAERPGQISAVVARGGRPDLAGPALARVEAPTLLLVGGDDEVVIDLNSLARARMHSEVQLEIVSGATHLFEEPGTLERVAALACDWFLHHSVGRPGLVASH